MAGFDPPYVGALVALQGEPDVRLTTDVVDVTAEQMHIGLRV
ncbi:OB-fold domain-containing protein [Mycobacterium avium]